jgi:hypothetical protein
VIAVALPAEANLARALVVFARWRRCASCGGRVLYVDQQLGTETAFSCGVCHRRAFTAQAANCNGESDVCEF